MSHDAEAVTSQPDRPASKMRMTTMSHLASVSSNLWLVQPARLASRYAPKHPAMTLQIGCPDPAPIVQHRIQGLGSCPPDGLPSPIHRFGPLNTCFRPFSSSFPDTRSASSTGQARDCLFGQARSPLLPPTTPAQRASGISPSFRYCLPSGSPQSFESRKPCPFQRCPAHLSITQKAIAEPWEPACPKDQSSSSANAIASGRPDRRQ